MDVVSERAGALGIDHLLVGDAERQHVVEARRVRL